MWLLDECNKNNVHAYSVTPAAQRNFLEYTQFGKSDILTLGIPDVRNQKENLQRTTNKMIFAVVGSVTKRKGQDLLLQALEEPELLRCNEVEFWIIGSGDNDFAKEIYNYGGVLGEKINGKGTVIFADDKIIPPIRQNCRLRHARTSSWP